MRRGGTVDIWDKEKRKTSEKVHGCSDGGRAEGLCNRRGCEGEIRGCGDT